MSALEISNSFKNKKGSPFCNNINKSLLTPCRQIGLSRKRKTPVSSSVKTISEDLVTISNTIAVTNNYLKTENETTPNNFTKRHTYLQNSVSEVDIVLQRKCNSNHSYDEEVSNENILQTYISKDLLDNKSNVIEENVTETEYAKQKTSNFNRKLKKRRLSTDFSNFENICLQNEGLSEIIINDCDNKFVTNKQRKVEDLDNMLSLRKSDSTTCKALENFNMKEQICIENFKIQLHKLSEDEIDSALNKCIKNENLNKQSNSNFLDDAHFFTSSPEEENIKRKKLDKNIKLLENQLTQKRLLLDNLRRAYIYKNKHNIQDLKQLTSIWLDGCIQALRDLLTHLRAHGPIDMTTVLNNMGIPKEIIVKLNCDI